MLYGIFMGTSRSIIITYSVFIALFVSSLFIVFFPIVRFRRYVDKLPERIVLSSGAADTLACLDQHDNRNWGASSHEAVFKLSLEAVYRIDK